MYSVFLRDSGMGGFCFQPVDRGPGVGVRGLGVVGEGDEGVLVGPWVAEV